MQYVQIVEGLLTQSQNYTKSLSGRIGESMALEASTTH